MWDFYIAETRTGDILRKVRPVQVPGNWARRLDHKASGTDAFHVLPAPDGEPYNLNTGLWDTLDAPPASRMLAVEWEGSPIYLGLIWGMTYSVRTGVLSVTHEDIWSLWEGRMAVPQEQTWADQENPVAFKFKNVRANLGGWDVGTLMKKVTQWGTQAPAEDMQPLWDLPILYPADVSGSESVSQRGWDYPTVAQTLSRLGERDDAPSLDFRPERVGRSFRWRMVTVDDPDGETHLHLTSPDSPVTEVGLARDGSEYAIELHVTGEGSELDILADRIWWSTQSGNDRIVGLAAVESYPEIREGPELTQMMHGRFSQRRRWVEQMSLTVNLGEPGSESVMAVSDLHPGRGIVTRSYGDPVLPDGRRSWMLIGVKPAGEQTVVLELQQKLSPIVS